ncbi:cation-dependent mannose-6-phosphate receptor [Echeneis naucrates]|uniref:Cation-dependent mannose-6-phosphate receptor n=1 Tax=Echeneis naucrates TaxID=173247 RepID=A0A665W8G8_ECHNA|nr:cation-dependent mannose-6-phosphate receptor [Echeneis naucrates]
MKVLGCPGVRPFLVWVLTVQLILWGSGVSAAESIGNCKQLSYSASEWEVLKRVEPLSRKNFTVQDKSYTYIFQLCGDAGGVPGAGIIQVDKDDAGKKPTIIGMYNTTQAIGGSDWVMLIYGNGDTYKGHCSKEKRRAIIMISCDRNTDMGKLEVVLEDRNRTEQCFYLFELDSHAVCPVIESELSTGSILLIIGFSFLAVYLTGGFLYQRLIVGAKGMEQFPNYAFWVEVGNLTADGCDFVCRSRNREESQAYRGIAPDTLAEEPEERDDHLLPM